MAGPVHAHDQIQQTPLRSRAALESLRTHIGDDIVIDRLASTYPTWEDLRSASANMTQYARAVAGLPARPEPHVGLPPATVWMSRYEIRFPSGVRSLRHPPLMLYVRGAGLSDETVAVIGADRPSPVGVEVARDTALAAAAADVKVVARLDTVLGRTALLEAIRAGSAPLAVSVTGFNVISADAAVANQVLDAGGTVIYPNSPQATDTAGHRSAADATVVGLSQAVVVAEAGVHDSAGRDCVTQAIRAQRPLIVPRLDAELVKERYVPDTMVGCEALTNPARFCADYYGTNAAIDHRVHNGLPAADSIVVTQADLALAIAEHVSA